MINRTKLRRPLAAMIVAIGVTLSIHCFGAEPIIDIGSHRELFIDRYLIDKTAGTELRLQHPHDEGVVLKFDQPWEGPFCAYVTVIHAGPKYQMFYRGAFGENPQVTCYAESSDGISWTKPQLDLHPDSNGGKTNIVIANAGKVTHNFSPFLDANPDAKPDERYKALGGYDDIGLFAYVSPDGIHWRKMRDEPVFTRKEVFPTQLAFDSQNVPFWSEAEGKYLLYFRVYKNKFRRIARAQSDDFVHWTDPQLMEYRHDGGDAPIEQLYTNQTSPYFRALQIYISTAARFMLGRKVITTQQAQEIHVNPKYFGDTSDAILMTSRGGNFYDRTFLGAFVAPGIGPENWISRTNYPALNVVQTGPAEMSVYLNQNYAQPTANLHRYSLRLDGFAALHAEYEGGEMITKPLKFSGSQLLLNFATSAAGSIQVEIQDESGTPIPDFSLADCTPVIGNEIERPAVWKGGDLHDLAGKPVRLRFVMKDADVFALRFAEKTTP
jgi:hypothetical protein